MATRIFNEEARKTGNQERDNCDTQFGRQLNPRRCQDIIEMIEPIQNSQLPSSLLPGFLVRVPRLWSTSAKPPNVNRP